MYSTVPAGSLVTLGGHLRVVLHSDDATASVSADPRRHWRTEKSPRRFHRKRAFAIGQFSEILRNPHNVKICGLNKVIILPFFAIYIREILCTSWDTSDYSRYYSTHVTAMQKLTYDRIKKEEKTLMMANFWSVQDNAICNKMHFLCTHPSADSTHSYAMA